MTTETIKITEDTSEKISKASKILGMKREEIVDNGLDGRVNKGSSLPTKTFYNNAWDQVSFAPQFTYFQEKYIKALDAIIAVCEGKQ